MFSLHSFPKVTMSRRRKSKPKNSTEDFFASSHIQPPTDMAEIGEGLMRVVSEMLASDPQELFAPMKVTPSVKKKIRRLQLARKQTWVATIDSEATNEGNLLSASVYLVDKEHGSNGLPLGDSDGVSLHLSTATSLSTSWDRTDSFPVLLGAICTACLEPCKLSPFSAVGTVNQAFPSQRPGRLLLDSTGYMEQLRPDLMEMGITDLGVAEAAILESVQSFNGMYGQKTSTMQRLASSTSSEQEFRQAFAESLIEMANDVYVSEEPQPLNGWTPPPDVIVPFEWFVRPPADISSYRLTDLWGWRTNLERAVLQADTEKIQEIAEQRDMDQIREFCEIRILLTKVAEKGMLKACQALVDICGVQVDGVRDTPTKWRRLQHQAGDTETTPLHRAAFEGLLPVVEFLLERGASVTATDGKVDGTALLHAVSQGHSDCVRALLEHGSDPAFFSQCGGEALDLSHMMEMQGGAHIAAQRRVRQVLREYDTRCSNCRASGPEIKNCPCQLERYCGRNCQVWETVFSLC